jgi:hypothetical protein
MKSLLAVCICLAAACAAAPAFGAQRAPRATTNPCPAGSAWLAPHCVLLNPGLPTASQDALIQGAAATQAKKAGWKLFCAYQMQPQIAAKTAKGPAYDVTVPTYLCLEYTPDPENGISTITVDGQSIVITPHAWFFAIRSGCSLSIAYKSGKPAVVDGCSKTAAVAISKVLAADVKLG